jgi:hypothetical protein
VDESDTVAGMSLAELKKESVRLSAAEKRELAEFLQAQIEPQAATRRERVNVLMREMDAGRKFSRAEFERTDRDLSATGL